MQQIKFTVLGDAVPQGRPKFARIGNHVTAYDPAKSRNYKSIVRDEAIKVKPDKPLEGPLILNVTVFKSIPKSLSKKKRELAIAGTLLPTTKPDLSNLIKGLEDAMLKIIYNDDSQRTNF
jgi:Holliday junction resolvase RusA-like endonuclease